MYKDELSIFIPNSFLSESKDLKIRTYKVGILGRALAIFQADNVVIYNDDNVKNEDGENDEGYNSYYSDDNDDGNNNDYFEN